MEREREKQTGAKVRHAAAGRPASSISATSETFSVLRVSGFLKAVDLPSRSLQFNLRTAGGSNTLTLKLTGQNTGNVVAVLLLLVCCRLPSVSASGRNGLVGLGWVGGWVGGGVNVPHRPI